MLGLAAVHTAFQLWQFNKIKNQKDETAPFRWAVGGVAVYLVIIITVNILLEAAYTDDLFSFESIASIGAKALLSLLSIVAEFVLALRSQHAQRLTVKQELAKVTKERNSLKGIELKLNQEHTRLKHAETQLKQLETKLEGMTKAETELKQLWNTLPKHVQAATTQLVIGGTVRELAEQFNTSPSSISRAKQKLFSANAANSNK